MYDEYEEQPRCASYGILPRTMYAVRDAGWFLGAFLALWPEPIFKMYLDRLGMCKEGALSTFPMDINFVHVGVGVLVFNLVWTLLSNRMKLGPKRFCEWRLMLQFLMVPLGLSAGMAWRTAVGVTTWEACCQQGHPAVVGMHWRPEIRAMTGLDSLFGIDLTVPRAEAYRVSKALSAGQCEAQRHQAHALGGLYASDASARICRDRSGDILTV